jgi:hypothetical protein
MQYPSHRIPSNHARSTTVQPVRYDGGLDLLHTQVAPLAPHHGSGTQQLPLPFPSQFTLMIYRSHGRSSADDLPVHVRR